MKDFTKNSWVRFGISCGVICLVASPAFAVGVNPFSAPFTAVKDFFVGEVALYGSLIAMVVGGITKAAGHGHHDGLGNVFLGAGFAMFAVQTINWLYT
jgi:type IV secretory pathway VirB2 component (pilin)